MAATRIITPTRLIVAAAVLLAAAIHRVDYLLVPSHHRDAVVALDAASKAKTPQERLALLNAAREAQIASLAALPGDPYGWRRLAYLRQTTQGQRPMALSSLHMSYLTGPYEPFIEVDRAIAFFELRDAHTDEDKILMRDAWRAAAHRSMKALVAGLTRKRSAVADVDAALAGGAPDVYARWQKSRKAAGI